MDEKKKRAAIHRALLRNDSISTVFKDAMGAPIGSTKREKARRMASIVKKTLGRYDGQGGPGFPTSGVGTFVMPVQPMMQDPVANSMVIFKAPPAPSYRDPYQEQASADGQGGPGDLSRLTLGAGAATPPGLSGFTMGQPSQQSQPTNPSSLLTGTGIPKMVNVFGGSSPQMTGITPKNPSQLSLGSALSPSGFNFGTSGAQPAPQAGAPGALAPAPVPVGAAAPGESGQPPMAGSGRPPSPVIPITSPLHPGYTGGDADYTETPPGGGTGPGSSYSGLTGALDAALGSSTGPSTFAYGTMNDISALRELFPGVSDDQLPVGASLSGQIDALSKALRNEYDIDALTEDLSTKIREGVTLDQDLKDYVRGKDTYLNEVNDMLGDAKRQAIKKSGGPDAGIFNDYVNYLTVLKGRQNKRYIDFYNDSIGVYQKELDTLQSELENATNAYTKELETRATIKQEDYNRMYTSLTEMYNAAEAAPQKQLELQLMQAELAQALGDLGGNSASGVSTDWIDVFGNLKTKGVLINPDTGTLLPQVSSLESALETIVSDGNTDVGGAYRILGEAISNDLGSDGGDLPSFFSKVKKYERMLTDLKGQAQTDAIMQKYGYDMTPAIDNLSQTLASRAGEAVSQYVLGNADSMRKLVKDASGNSGWFGLGGVPDRGSFVSKNSSKEMPEELTGRIYDYVSAIKSADPSGTSVKSFLDLPDDQFSKALSHGLGVSLFSSALGG